MVNISNHLRDLADRIDEGEIGVENCNINYKLIPQPVLRDENNEFAKTDIAELKIQFKHRGD